MVFEKNSILQPCLMASNVKIIGSPFVMAKSIPIYPGIDKVYNVHCVHSKKLINTSSQLVQVFSPISSTVCESRSSILPY